MHLLGTWQIFRRGNVLLFKLYFDVCYYIVLVVEVDFCLKLTYVYINSYKHRMFTFGSGEIFRNSQRFFFFFFLPGWAKEINKSSTAATVTHLSVNPVSQTDCYVRLWLPTASHQEARTRTVSNCRNPVWNETFHFMIQSEVKVRSITELMS